MAPYVYSANTIRLISRFTYKGQAHLTSNDWSFTGEAMAPADCVSLSTAIANIQCHLAQGTFSNHIIKAYCYSPGDSTARYQEDFTSGGTTAGLAYDGSYLTSGSTDAQQQEVCGLLRAPCGRDTKGRQKYVRKFLHIQSSTNANPDEMPALNSTGVTALAALHTGGIGDNDYLSATPSGVAIAGAWTMETYLVTHQLRQ